MTDEIKSIETWKLDLERLLWSYHENGRPDGKTGVIGNPKTIEEFVVKLMDQQYKMGKGDSTLAIQLERERLTTKIKSHIEFYENDEDSNPIYREGNLNGLGLALNSLSHSEEEHDK